MSDASNQALDTLQETYSWADSWFVEESVFGCKVGYKLKTKGFPEAKFSARGTSFEEAIGRLAEDQAQIKETCSWTT